MFSPVKFIHLSFYSIMNFMKISLQRGKPAQDGFNMIMVVYFPCMV